IGRPQRTGFVVDAGVQHAGVVPRLMMGEFPFLFEDGDRSAGKPFEKPIRRRESDNSAANDGDVGGLHNESQPYKRWARIRRRSIVVEWEWGNLGGGGLEVDITEPRKTQSEIWLIPVAVIVLAGVWLTFQPAGTRHGTLIRTPGRYDSPHKKAFVEFQTNEAN